LLLLPLQITSKNYPDVPIFTGDLVDVDIGSAPYCRIPNAGPERASDCIEIARAVVTIVVAVGQTNDGTVYQFVKLSGFTGSHRALKK
jgi:hypothetical protein